MYKERFALIYGLLAACSIVAICFTLLSVFTPYTPVAHKSDLGAPSTDKVLIALAENINMTQASQSGVTILKQTVLGTSQKDKNTVVVRIKTKTIEAGTRTVIVTLHRGIWSVTNFQVK